HAGLQPAQLVLEPQNVLNAGEIETELGREALDEPQPLDVGVRGETCATRRARRRDETSRLVHPQRLRVQPGQVGRDRDHVPPALGHCYELLTRWSRGCSRRTSP